MLTVCHRSPFRRYYVDMRALWDTAGALAVVIVFGLLVLRFLGFV